MPKDQIIDDQCSSPVVKSALAQPTRQRLGRAMHFSAGFTLVELVVVTAIIGVLATLAIPTYNNFIDRARNARAKQEVRLLETEINAYRFDTNSFPANLATIHRDGLLDPWKHPYVYSNNPRAFTRTRFDNPLNDDYDLCSMGADGLTADVVFVVGGGPGNDDLVRGGNGAFVGLGSDW